MNGFDFLIGKPADSGNGGNGYEINEDLTNATLETLEHEAQIANMFSNFFSDSPDAFDAFDFPRPRRIGTVVNQEVLKRVYEANKFLEIIQIAGDTKIEKFTEPNPYDKDAFVAFTTQDCFMRYDLTVKNAFSSLIDLCDEMIVRTIDDTHNRYVFIFSNLWEQYRIEEEKEE